MIALRKQREARVSQQALDAPPERCAQHKTSHVVPGTPVLRNRQLILTDKTWKVIMSGEKCSEDFISIKHFCKIVSKNQCYRTKK